MSSGGAANSGRSPQPEASFDIVAQAGVTLKALDKSFPVSVTNGRINIQFAPGPADQPLVNAIEILTN